MCREDEFGVRFEVHERRSWPAVACAAHCYTINLGYDPSRRCDVESKVPRDTLRISWTVLLSEPYQPGNARDELSRLDRLGKVQVKSGQQGALTILCPGIGRDRYRG